MITDDMTWETCDIITVQWGARQTPLGPMSLRHVTTLVPSSIDRTFFSGASIQVRVYG